VQQESEDNKEKLLTQAGGLTSELMMPRLVYLPSVVAKIEAESSRTAWDLYQFVNNLIAQDSSHVADEDVANIKQWLLTVGQTVGAKGLALTIVSLVKW
jgi:hypothetical protein